MKQKRERNEPNKVVSINLLISLLSVAIMKDDESDDHDDDHDSGGNVDDIYNEKMTTNNG